MEKVALSPTLVNGILTYLSKQPYAEVAQLIAGIMNERQAAQKSSAGVDNKA